MQWMTYKGDDPIPTEGRTTRLYVGPDPSGEHTPADRVGTPGPQVFLPQLHGGRTGLEVHFHRVPQFQYFSHGTSRIGRHDAEEGTLHFADAFTPYGPIRPGAVGCAFLTIREHVDINAFYMPEAQETLRTLREAHPRALHRNLVFDLRTTPGECGTWQQLSDEPDGLRVRVAAFGSGEMLSLPHDDEVKGFFLVVAGEVDDGDLIPARSLARYDSTEVPLTVRAGPAGAHIAMLELPICC